MRGIGIKQLKNELSRHVRAAAAGETVLVLDRGRVVAELGPPRRAATTDSQDAIMARLIAEGLVTPPTAPAYRPAEPKAEDTLEQLLAELDEDRADRF